MFLLTIYDALVVAFIRTGALTVLSVNIFSILAFSIQIIAKTLILAVLSSLGRGLLRARTGERPKLGLPVAILTYALVAVNSVLAIADLGLGLAYWVGGVGLDDYDYDIVLHINRLEFVPHIFIFVGSIASLAASGLVFVKVKSKYPTLKSVCCPPPSLFPSNS